MLRRFVIFGIGFLLGCMMVYYLFFQRDDTSLTGWLPSNFIKAELIRTLDTTRIPACVINCAGLNSMHLNVFIEKSDILFGRSDPNKTPKHYLLKGSNREDKCIEIMFALSANKSEIIQVSGCDTTETCDCF